MDFLFGVKLAHILFLGHSIEVRISEAQVLFEITDYLLTNTFLFINFWPGGVGHSVLEEGIKHIFQFWKKKKENIIIMVSIQINYTLY